MKNFTTTLLIASALSVGAIVSPAADQDTQRPRPGGKQDKVDRQGKGSGRDILFAALDTDGDGTLSTKELQNAAAALAKLDKNGDGNLTQEELAPAKSGKGGKGKDGKGNKQNKTRN